MFNDFEENEAFIKAVEQLQAKEICTLLVDDDGEKYSISQDKDPYHGKLFDRDQLLELIKNDSDFKGKYLSGYYCYKGDKLFVKNKVRIIEGSFISAGTFPVGPTLSAAAIQKLTKDYKTYHVKRSFNDFYEAVDYFMKDRKVTQLMIAQEMNVSAAYISRILNKRETLTVNLVVCFSLILKLSPYYSKKLLSLAGFTIEDNPKYSLYLLLLNEHYNASLEYCNAIVDALSSDNEKDEYRLIRKRND